MKTDLYSKIVLTVIAACLVVIVLRDTQVITPAYATVAPAPLDQNNIKANYDGSINVRVIEVSRTIPVDVKSVNTPYGGFPVDVKNSYIQTKPY